MIIACKFSTFIININRCLIDIPLYRLHMKLSQRSSEGIEKRINQQRKQIRTDPEA